MRLVGRSQHNSMAYFMTFMQLGIMLALSQRNADRSFQCESVKIAHDQGVISATYKVCSSPLDDTVYIQVTHSNKNKNGNQSSDESKNSQKAADMLINIEGWIEKRYSMPNNAKYARFSPIEYDNARTIRKLSTAFKHIRHCVEKGTTKRCKKYKAMLVKENHELTIALQDTGSEFLIDDQTSAWLSSAKSNKRLRRAALAISWCPPQFICHGRTNITKTTKQKSSFQQTQLKTPPRYNIKLQVKSMAAAAKPNNQPNQSSNKAQKQQQQKLKKKLVIIFHGTDHLKNRKRRDLPAAENKAADENLDTVLDNVVRCLSVMKFIKTTTTT